MRNRRKASLVIILIVLLIILSANFLYPKKEEVPEEVQKTYVNYLETIKYDYAKAANEFCHFEMPAVKKMIEQSDDYITNYRILRWEALNEELWVVKTAFQTLLSPEESTMYNFIGKIDEEYYVMVNSYQVPSQLHKNFNPLHYFPANAVPYQNVVGLQD